ncbi:MAG: hypothetical protein HYX74_00580 [Acidobacteria bacterium]|nr:hypothetical protein [Acidobacteriota bacterium]
MDIRLFPSTARRRRFLIQASGGALACRRHVEKNRPPYALLAMLLLALTPPVVADSVLNFPRLSNAPGSLTGVAIFNPSDQAAAVMVTAYDSQGQLLAGATQNPASLVVPAGQQVSRLTSELFGTGLPADATAWFQATSSTDGLAGFFLFLRAGVEFDGADLPVAARQIVFNQVRVDSGYSTELDIINPAATAVNLQLRLVAVQTAPETFAPVSKTLPLPAKGVARLDVATFFQVTLTSPGAYVTVSAETEVAGFELVKSAAGDLMGLNARNSSEQLSTLYFPQLAVLGPWKTELGLVNYSSVPAIVTAKAYRGDGRLYDTANLKNNPVTRVLEGGGSLREDVATMFGFSGTEPLEGWIQVESSAAALNGYVSYGTGPSLAAVAAAAQGSTRALFSHIATSQGFFNGVAILNPGTLAANLRVLAIRPDGQVLGNFETVLQPGQRISRLIDELIPPATNQAGGVIWVKADQPLFLTELFGAAGTLANVPSQTAPDDYQPDRGTAALSVIPPLAPVQTGGRQQFQVQPDGTFTWKVNGIAGGSGTFGTIDSSGLYRAPASIPTPQVLTVTAESGTRAAGASVDVLEKLTLLESLAPLQSVVYLGSLEKLYVAELASFSAAKPTGRGAANSAFEADSVISEVSPGGSRTSLASYQDEVVSKMIGFTASNGREYLLLAGQTTGRIIRLDPATQRSTDVFSGLVEPSALVMDPVTGNLLVAERERITAIPPSLLNSGLGKAPPQFQDRRATLALESSAKGIVVDACTGDIYFSASSRKLSTTGQIAVLDRSTGTVRTLVSGLSNPGQLLGLYRSGISCPAAFHLLAAEMDTDRVALIVPGERSVSTWVPSRGTSDIAFLPRGTGLAPSEGILLAESTEVLTRRIAFVATSDFYQDAPINPPALNFPDTVDVTINPASATVVRGARQQFTAVVTGSRDAGVTWTTTRGEISGTGLYTAPQTAGLDSVRATSRADATQFAEASVRVIAIRVTISPTNVILRPGAVQQFAAAVSGSSNTGVNWTATGGQVSSAGLYTAPRVPGTYSVRATSQVDSSSFAEAAVTVTAVQVSIAPTSATLAGGDTLQFAATVTGSDNTAVAWATTGGKISEKGFYTAPETAGIYRVRATSQANTSKFAEAAVTVTTNIRVTISPTRAVVPTGSSRQFAASVTGSNNAAVIWTTNGGRITKTGLYTAPQTAGLYAVRATAQADTSKFAEATASVILVTVTVSPSSVTLAPGGTQQFSAVVGGTSDTAVTWTTTGGAVTESGFYVAPREPGVYIVRATSQADSSKFAEATVNVMGDVSVSISPAKVTLSAGAQQQFTAVVTGTANQNVFWTASGGTVTNTGLYTAPTSTGNFIVRAASQADPKKFAEATVAVVQIN